MVRLVRADLHLLDAALAGDEALADAVGVPVAPAWASFTEALQPARDALAARGGDARWSARFFVTEDPPELVGWGGFKGPPNDGVVELGYEIAESRQGRGLATGGVAAMAEHAWADDRVTALIAHTLPEHNASTRVLEKSGFRHDGEVTENGERVWRWRRERA
jgi:RimJ/RimL family protein N-acetyltransferase